MNAIPHQVRQRRPMSLLALLAASIVAIAGHAETASRPQGDRAADQGRDDSVGEVSIASMRAHRASSVITELELDELSSTRVLPILARYDERDLALMVERRDTACELRKLVSAARPDDTGITRALDRLTATRARRHALHDERLDELRAVLSPMQLARFLLAAPDFEQAFRRWAWRVMGDGGRFCDRASRDETVGRSTSKRTAKQGRP